jgi:hypothetical protein
MALVDVSRAGQLPPSVQIAVLAALAAACAVGQRLSTAAAAAGVVWLVLLGFVVNRDGELELTGAIDLVWLLVLSAAALMAARTTR